MGSSVSGNRTGDGARGEFFFGIGGFGGGIYNHATGMTSMSNSTVAMNVTGAGEESYGGGIYSRLDTTVSISNSTITQNTAGTAGGGIRNQGNNKIAARDLGSGESLKIAAATKTGLVSGSYGLKSTRQSVKFKGVAFQKQGIAAGVFPGEDGETGFFLIKPNGEPQIAVDGNTADSFLFRFTNAVGVDGGIGERQLLIENRGDANLYIPNGPAVPDGSEFSIVGGGPVLLEPGESTTFTIRFDPDSFGLRASTVAISSNAAGQNPFIFAVDGVGTAGTTDGARVAYDQWTGDSPADRVQPFATDVIGTFDPANRGGKYEGYVREENVGQDLVGAMTLNMRTRDGAFSATASVDGIKHRLKGSFDTVADDGVIDGFTNTGLAFHLEVVDVLTGGVGSKIIGTIGDKRVELIRDWSHIEDGAFVFEGRYTMVLPSSDERGVGQPGGDGYGAMTLANNGRIKASIVLGDGSKLTHSGLMSVDSEWLFYKDLYRTKPKGFIGGRVVFRELANVSDFDGTFQWMKHADSREKRYPHGFELRQPVLGCRYNAPNAGQIALNGVGDVVENVQLRLSESDIENLPGPLNVTWDTRNRISYTPVGTERISIRVVAKTGLISGNYRDRTTGVNASFGAVIFNKQDLATGTLFGPTETGVVGMEGLPP